MCERVGWSKTSLIVGHYGLFFCLPGADVGLRCRPESWDVTVSYSGFCGPVSWAAGAAAALRFGSVRSP